MAQEDMMPSHTDNLRRTIRVFRNSRAVRVARNGRIPVPHATSFGKTTNISGFRMELVARGTGTVVYKSKKCATREQADGLCDAWLKRNPHIIDTSGES
jgi:hypothetical protein